ncbi:hypothetical protein ACF0C8_10115 [Pseudomonas aeruginosa]|uniref:hypothetical protein n=2 Tax=Pseudomonas aeruginosa TaxID=287 RepID=UPI000F45B313|nr:hypothetical protein [Pseudomonas aeruginosa]EKL0657274.1 hypothetical protein [Pseudomonas aeruginosa]EKV6736690.1 hypothetical protein [Pseudomonas aeruginosa]EKV6880023.1 hypothetical protein [Pseudomonas aeruginosa]EKX3284505.1 hypothetical protein [Pseudomonas aeruginosa]ELF7088503.1 hypothetical protein [Pseudomonas aeruginosa]
MSKHTPGPWFINGHERYTKYVEARIGGGWVQEVAACGPTENPEQQEANARLIAAAPELLEALQSCIQQITALCSADDVPDQARAAIAKATA